MDFGFYLPLHISLIPDKRLFILMIEIYLASTSPRRIQMFKDLGLNFKTHSPDIDEKKLRGEPALHYANRLSFQKASKAVSNLFHFEIKKSTSFYAPTLPEKGFEKDWAVLAADTIVVMQGQVLGKPKDEADAVKTLSKLSGKTHDVITSFSWVGYHSGKIKQLTHHSKTKVSFSDKPIDFWRWYVATGEPMDKAGSYGAQGYGNIFIEKLTGSYSNVVGLPLSETLIAYKKLFGVDLVEYKK